MIMVVMMTLLPDDATWKQEMLAHLKNNKLGNYFQIKCFTKKIATNQTEVSLAEVTVASVLLKSVLQSIAIDVQEWKGSHYVTYSLLKLRTLAACCPKELASYNWHIKENKKEYNNWSSVLCTLRKDNAISQWSCCSQPKLASIAASTNHPSLT